jgi:hypothetical protein
LPPTGSGGKIKSSSSASVSLVKALLMVNNDSTGSNKAQCKWVATNNGQTKKPATFVAGFA